MTMPESEFAELIEAFQSLYNRMEAIQHEANLLQHKWITSRNPDETFTDDQFKKYNALMLKIARL